MESENSLIRKLFRLRRIIVREGVTDSRCPAEAYQNRIKKSSPTNGSDGVRWRTCGNSFRRFCACRTISVIIPALNESETIYGCVKASLSGSHVIEAIVVDGGSEDATRSEAVRAGARIVVHNAPIRNGGGRGGQINAGLSHARGDIVAIVHADTHVPAAAFRKMLHALNTRKGVVGGGVGCRFSTGRSATGTRIRCRIVEYLNHARVMLTGISFGDQVQFFRREAVVRRNLYPAIPLMEDIELAIRLRRIGRLVYLNGKAVVSARRWEKQGSANAFLIIALSLLYLFRRLNDKADPAFFYQVYYGVKV